MPVEVIPMRDSFDTYEIYNEMYGIHMTSHRDMYGHRIGYFRNTLSYIYFDSTMKLYIKNYNIEIGHTYTITTPYGTSVQYLCSRSIPIQNILEKARSISVMYRAKKIKMANHTIYCPTLEPQVNLYELGDRIDNLLAKLLVLLK